jgi:hypothetical protein
MHSFQKYKIPIPKRWPIKLFLGFYDIMEEYLLRFLNESIMADRLIVAFNSTFIDLIPKVHNPKSFNQYKPISICNFIYKIIAKVISMRIKKILSKNI